MSRTSTSIHSRPNLTNADEHLDAIEESVEQVTDTDGKDYVIFDIAVKGHLVTYFLSPAQWDKLRTEMEALAQADD